MTARYVGLVGEKARRRSGGGVAVAEGGLVDDEPPLCFEEDEEIAGAASYRIVECSSDRKSNIRTLPSAPTEAKISGDCGDHSTS